MMNKRGLVLTVMCLAASACDRGNTPSPIALPGQAESRKSAALEAGAKLLQGRDPLNAISTYLNGFHFYSDDVNGQMEAHHYVTMLNDDVMQAVIYDGNTENAKLMGIEYIISERLYKTLPPEEKKLWHSHRFEVKSGQLIAPNIPEAAERALMEKIVSTYGKTWHTWHTDRDKTLPLGIPALMMGFTATGQLNQQLLLDRDDRFKVSSTELAMKRNNLPEPAVDPAADSWQRGEAPHLSIDNGSIDNRSIENNMKTEKSESQQTSHAH